MSMALKTGLRERQKTRRRAEITAAGRKLFADNGYSATSMEMIAEMAEVGIATVYNYFGTKGRLLADILGADFDLLYTQGDDLLETPPPEPASGILSLIDIYRRFQDNWRHRSLLAAVIGPGLTADQALDELSVHAEFKVKQQLGALLSAYQQAGKVRADINIEDAALIIFYIFNQHFIEFVSQETVGFEEMRAAMDRQIRFIVTAILV